VDAVGGAAHEYPRSRPPLTFYRPWGFDVAGIRAPVSLWHGTQDFLPAAHARWLADRIPDVTTHFPAAEDHTNIEHNNRAAALAWLAARV
jgi:hypothetical protein